MPIKETCVCYIDSGEWNKRNSIRSDDEELKISLTINQRQQQKSAANINVYSHVPYYMILVPYHLALSYAASPGRKLVGNRDHAVSTSSELILRYSRNHLYQITT